jgi:hypothetical protein
MFKIGMVVMCVFTLQFERSVGLPNGESRIEPYLRDIGVECVVMDVGPSDPKMFDMYTNPVLMVDCTQGMKNLRLTKDEGYNRRVRNVVGGQECLK